MEGWGKVETIKIRRAYYMYSTYCECGSWSCGPAKGCGGRVSPYFPTERALRKWAAKQKDGSHERNKRFWIVKSITKQVK